MTPVDDEDDGYVLLLLGCGVPSTAALEAAMRLAKTVCGTIEGQFIEDATLIDAASYAFTREISYFGGRARDITGDTMIAGMRASARAMRHRLGAIARLHHVELHYRVVPATRERPCPLPGPRTRFLALSQPQTAGAPALLDRIASLPHIEGFLVASSRARRRHGPVLAVIRSAEDLQRLQSLLAPLASAGSRELLLLPGDPDPRRFHALVDTLQHLRLPQTRLLAPADISPATLERIVLRSDASLVVVGLDHPLAASRDALSQLATCLSTPLLLLRSEGAVDGCHDQLP